MERCSRADWTQRSQRALSIGADAFLRFTDRARPTERQNKRHRLSGRLFEQCLSLLRTRHAAEYRAAKRELRGFHQRREIRDRRFPTFGRRLASIKQRERGLHGINWGVGSDRLAPADYDGDGRTDAAVFRPSNGTWYHLNSSNNQFASVKFGQNGDAPLLADFDGDGKTDFSVFRNGVWYILRSSDLQVRITQFGLAGVAPVAGDYDADGRADMAVFRAGTWYVHRSADDGYTILNWGMVGDKPVPADYDNDGKTDFAVYRNGTWWILRSGDNAVSVLNFGLPTDIPIQTAYLP